MGGLAAPAAVVAASQEAVYRQGRQVVVLANRAVQFSLARRFSLFYQGLTSFSRLPIM